MDNSYKVSLKKSNFQIDDFLAFFGGLLGEVQDCLIQTFIIWIARNSQDYLLDSPRYLLLNFSIIFWFQRPGEINVNARSTL